MPAVPPPNDTLPPEGRTIPLSGDSPTEFMKQQGFERSITSFYQFLSPTDLNNKLKFPGAPDPSLKDKASVLWSALQKNYVKATLSGQKIIDNLKDMTELPSRGVGYNTAYIDKSGRAQFLDADYWTMRPDAKPTTAPAGAGQEIAVDSFYQTLCSTSGDPPPCPASINVLRMPYLSQARKNVEAITTFMNYMPPTFANQLVPYFDVEFQYPNQEQGVDAATGKQVQYLNHPSILRFLLGSEVELKTAQQTAGTLTDVDQALLSSLSSPINKGTYSGGGTSGGSTTSKQVTVSGMEMFTMPQTLTNMNTLRASGEARLLDVKPFLPPAVLTNASVTSLNSGTYTGKQTASLEFKMFDRARLVEFSDFLRGPIGIKGILVWVTFGWIAPRGRGKDDVYAKFVNENMLVRYAFSIKNSSFAFDGNGIVTVKIELSSAVAEVLDQSRIDTTGTKMQEAQKRVSDVLRAIHRRRSSYKNKAAEAEQALGTNKEIRIFQILDAADSGNLDTGLDPSTVNDTLAKELTRLKAENPVDTKSLELIRYVQELYQIDPDTKLPKYKMEMEKLARDYAKEKFKSLEDPSKDPFLPRPGKKGQYQFFGDDLIQAMKDVGQEATPSDAKGAPAKGSKAGAQSKGVGAGGGGGGSKGGGGGKGFDPKGPRKKYDPSKKDAFGTWESSVYASGGRDEYGNYYPDLDPAHDNGQFGPPPPPPENSSSSGEPAGSSMISPDIPQYTPAAYDPTADPIV